MRYLRTDSPLLLLVLVLILLLVLLLLLSATYIGDVSGIIPTQIRFVH